MFPLGPFFSFALFVLLLLEELVDVVDELGLGLKITVIKRYLISALLQ